MELTEAIKLAKECCPDDYARKYLDLVPAAIDQGERGLYAQLGYALNNMSSWQGPVAKEAKQVMRTWRKKYEQRSA